ncbi:MAG: hypothetical protein WEB00_06300 [Dehalococcoidia bacterium]
MKVILSRKGFDSSSGGYASPILPDGRLLSLPIPEPSRKPGTAIPYAELDAGNERSYRDVMAELGIRGFEDRGAHLDPDIRASVQPRPSGWRGLFGQTEGSQTHLQNEGIGPGDLFLFFGWFKPYGAARGPFWDPAWKGGAHVIWSYLQVAEVRPVRDEEERAAFLADHPWGVDHPHIRDWQRRGGNNTLYVASERLSLDASFPGAGVLDFAPVRVLTARDQPKRSVWRLPTAFDPACCDPPLSHHRKASAWEREGEGARLQSAGRGQEFVAPGSEGIVAWAKAVIEGQ